MSWSNTDGRLASVMTFRLSQEENEHLESQRRELGLTSKAEVLRLALDLLDSVASPGEFLLLGPDAYRKERQEWPALRERVIRKVLGESVDDPTTAGSSGALGPSTDSPFEEKNRTEAGTS